MNAQLVDRAVRHAVYVERLKTNEVRAVMTLLNRRVMPDILQQITYRLSDIAAGLRKVSYTDYRLQAMKQAIQGFMDSGMGSVHVMLEARLQTIAASEMESQVAMVKGAITVPLDFIAPAPNLLRAIVTERPFEGRILRDWFTELSQRAQGEISRQLNIGLVQGESVPQLVRRIRGTAEASWEDGTAGEIRRNLAAVTRTAVNSVVTNAREATYEENADLVTGVQIVATLDHRTCEICMAEDGQVYGVSAGPRPPFHFACRCSTAPVLKSWRQLGIPARELDAGTRASMDGQVSAKLTYGEWLGDQSKSVQDDALGPTRAEMFRTGKVAIDRFVDDQGRPLTLDQIRRWEGL